MATAGKLNPLERPVCFPAEALAARRERLFDIMGSGSRALLQRTPAPGGYVCFRQRNQARYRCGLETSRFRLLLDVWKTPSWGRTMGVEIPTSRAPLELDRVGALMREESARLAHVLRAT